MQWAATILEYQVTSDAISMADQHRKSSSSSSSSPSLPSNQRRDDSPFTTGAHKIYHRKDSYAVPPARSNVPPRRPAGLRTRAASYAGPSTSGSSRNDFVTGNSSNESSTSGNNKQYSLPHPPSSLSSISRVFAISTTAAPPNSSITLSTLSDPSRTAYPQSPTKQRLAAKRRRKQLTEAGLDRKLFEKVVLSDEKMNWSTHALPSSSVHHVGDSTMTDSERGVLAAEVRARLAEQGMSEVTRRKEVRWGTVHIREYKMVLGDNPSCIGAPLGLGWEWWVPSITCGRHVGDGRHDANLACRNDSSTLQQAGSSSHTNASISSDSGNSASNDVNVRTVDQYEKRRGLRLRGNQLKLSPLAREAILRRMGTRQSEIEAASTANYVAQIERNSTLAALANNSGSGNGSQWLDTVMKFFRHNGNENGSGGGDGGDVSRFPGESILRRTWSEPTLVPYSRNHCANSSDTRTRSSARGILKHDNKLGVKST